MTNSNYKTTIYTAEIEVERSPGDVFLHLVNLSKWWPEEFEGENISLNSEFVFKTGDGHYSKNRVVEFVPNKKVAWMATESKRHTDGFDWTGTKFIFELIPKNDKTQVRFTYDGVVLENETARLAQICDITLREFFYNYLIHGKTK